ncbi:MAG TPA: cytochrome c oxidase subunit II [Thermomicrobiales bacterium]|nr:cytochrome c oxidase subunit II [Thermomicrobiales bacterium]
MAQTTRSTSSRKGGLRRVLTLGALAIVALAVLAACGIEEPNPYSHVSPESPTAEDIHSLYKLVFWLALIVFVGVQFAIVYTAMRFRRRSAARRRPPQIHGNSRLEITWTVIPAVILLIILVPTITTLFAHGEAAEEGDLVVEVNGKQWWWEVIYNEDAYGNDLGVVTANHIRVPVGQETIFRLKSNNVIHSFWVPRLSGKMDVIPGHETELSITPLEPGVYHGECAEFCGIQHAWMRFEIHAMPEDQFYGWINAMRAGNPGTTNQDVELPEGVTRAPETMNVCLACHNIDGFEGSAGLAGMQAPRTFGPNLTNLACRDSIAAGLLINTPENLRVWIDNPGGVKPGNYMATQLQPGTFTDEQLDELVDYLLTLRPPGGCEDFLADPVGADVTAEGDLAATPADDTEVAVATPDVTPVDDDED